MSRFAAFVALKSCLVVAPGVAWAESSVMPATRFSAGAIHLLTEADHLLAIFALALLAGQVGRRALLWTPVGLSAGLLVGALSGAALPPLQQVDKSFPVECDVILLAAVDKYLVKEFFIRRPYFNFHLDPPQEGVIYQRFGIEIGAEYQEHAERHDDLLSGIEP